MVATGRPRAFETPGPARADKGLFLNVTPILRKKRLIIEVSALTPRSAER